MINICCLIIITIFIPPLGAWAVAGCGVDLLINICLTILGYFPGHIHAFYLIYVYNDRRNNPGKGRAGGVYSEKCQTGGRGYGAAPAGIQQGQYVAPQQAV